MFDSGSGSGSGGLGRVVAAFADLTGCDLDALATLVEQRPDTATSPAGTGTAATVAASFDPASFDPASFDPAAVLDRIGASERLSQAAQAVQVEQLAVFNVGYLADTDAGVDDRDRDVPSTSRLAGIEVAEQLRVAPITAMLKLANAARAVHWHRPVLDLVGTGQVSMAGLGRVLEATAVLDPHRQQSVAVALAAEATRRGLTPGQLGQAANRRVLAADPDAAANRVAAARRDRSVRLGDPVDGVAGVYATVRAEEAVAIWAGLDRTARGLRGHGDPRPLDTLRADLFVEHLTGRPLTRIPDPRFPAGEATQTVGDTARTGAKEPVVATDPTAAAAGLPVVWRRTRGVEPAFEKVPPPLLADPDPPPDDPVWDHYLSTAAPDPPDRHGLDQDRAGPNDHPPPQWRAGLDVEVQVVVSLATVLGLDRQPGLLRGYGAIPADTVAEIVQMAEASGARTWLRALFCDPLDGRLVAMSSRSQHFTGDLRLFGIFRDQTDRLTGGPITDLDHLHPKTNGGKTTAANAQALGMFTNRVVKQHPDVHVRALPTQPHHDGLDNYRHHAPDIEWTLPSGHRHHSQPPPALGPGSDPHHNHPDDCPHHPDTFWESDWDGDPHELTALENELYALLDTATG